MQTYHVWLWAIHVLCQSSNKRQLSWGGTQCKVSASILHWNCSVRHGTLKSQRISSLSSTANSLQLIHTHTGTQRHASVHTHKHIHTHTHKDWWKSTVFLASLSMEDRTVLHDNLQTDWQIWQKTQPCLIGAFKEITLVQDQSNINKTSGFCDWGKMGKDVENQLVDQNDKKIFLIKSSVH